MVNSNIKPQARDKFVGSENILENLLERMNRITDPELPFISIEDLGILRKIETSQEEGVLKVTVTLTPTFSGCPAMFEIKQRVIHVLKEFQSKIPGTFTYHIDTELFPPWNSRSITERGKKILQENGYGLESEGIICPRCKSREVVITSEFGSTACKKFAHCQQCREPFEVFKSIT